MSDVYLMKLHLWLFQHWLFHAHMYGIYNGVKEKEEMHNAENSIWRTFIYCTARLNMRLTETLTPPTA